MSEERIVYEQALETVRSVTNQVVSTGGIFVVRFVTVVSFSFTHQSWLLLAASSMFMIVLWALLRRWQLIVWSSLDAAQAYEPARPGLAAWMGTRSDGVWVKVRWKVYAPLVVAVVTLAAAAVVAGFVDSWSAPGIPPDTSPLVRIIVGAHRFRGARSP